MISSVEVCPLVFCSIMPLVCLLPQIRRIRAGRGVQQAALEQLCDVVVNGADSVRKAECVQACLELGAALGA